MPKHSSRARRLDSRPFLAAGIENSVLALSLLVLGVLADDHDLAFSSNDLALLADLLYRRLHFHGDTIPFCTFELWLFGSPGDTSLIQVVNRHFNGNVIAGQYANIVQSKLSRNVSGHQMTVGKSYLEGGVGQCLFDDTLKFNDIIL